MDLYAENILEHYKEPKNRGRGQGASSTGKEDNPSCGDWIAVYLWIEDEKIEKIEWEGDGCAISQAAMSMLSEELAGKTIDDVLALKKQDIYEMLGIEISTRRAKCALLCLLTVQNVLQSTKKKSRIGWNDLLCSR